MFLAIKAVHKNIKIKRIFCSNHVHNILRLFDSKFSFHHKSLLFITNLVITGKDLLKNRN